MPRTTHQMRVLSPVATEAPGSREITGVQGVRSDGTFVGSDQGEWFEQRALQDASQSVEAMLSASRNKLGLKAPKPAELPLAARLAQRAGDKLLAELGAKDSFELSEGTASSEEKHARRTTSTFSEPLDEPKEGLFKRLLRRGHHQGHSKK